MKELTFIQLHENSNELFEMAKSVWVPFIHEINVNDGITQTDDDITDGLKKRIHIQGTRKDMHFEIALLGDKVIGISMFAIDLGTIYGLLESPGYGTVMGFYIIPQYRRQGLGKAFFEHIQITLRNDGADKMYVCPDAVTGIPFWNAMGFNDSGKVDPDDKMPIYVKSI